MRKLRLSPQTSKLLVLCLKAFSGSWWPTAAAALRHSMSDSSRELSENADSRNSESGARESVILMSAQEIQAKKPTNTHKSTLLELMIKTLHELALRNFQGTFLLILPIPTEENLHLWVFPNIISLVCLQKHFSHCSVHMNPWGILLCCDSDSVVLEPETRSLWPVPGALTGMLWVRRVCCTLHHDSTVALIRTL